MAKRCEYDFYPTPEEVVDKLISNYDFYGNVLEPSAGDGIIINKLAQVQEIGNIDAIEIDESHKEKLLNVCDNVVFGDYLQMDVGSYDWIITNPPFSLAQEFVEKSINSGANVCMLLRLNFLGSQKRHEFWKKYPPNKILVLSKRPSFTGTGTDSQEYAWFIWDGIIYRKPIQVI